MARFSKCFLGQVEIEILGHVVNGEGIRTDPRKLAAVRNAKFPTNVREIRAFIGMSSYYRCFIKDYVMVTEPLVKMTRKNAKVVWSEEAQRALDAVKAALTEAPVLAYPDFTQPFRLVTDASDMAIAAVLEQLNPKMGFYHVVRYESKLLKGGQINWTAGEKECFTTVYYLEKLKHYLEGNLEDIVMDCSTVVWLFNKAEPKGKFACWILGIQHHFPIKIRHRAGTKIPHTDALTHPPFISLMGEEEPRIKVLSEQRGRAAPSVGAKMVKTGEFVEFPEDFKGVANLEALRRDPKIGKIIDTLEGKQLEGRDRQEKREIQEAIKRSERCAIIEGSLFRYYWGKTGSGVPTACQWVVLEDRRADLIQVYHDSMSGGHFRFRKTYGRLIR